MSVAGSPFAEHRAILIGVDEHAHQDRMMDCNPDLMPLRWAESDAKRLFETLTACGYRRENISLILGTEATFDRIEQCFNSISAASSSPVLAYWAGHGWKGYLLPFDFDPERRTYESAFAYSWLFSRIGELHAPAALLVDACGSEPRQNLTGSSIAKLFIGSQNPVDTGGGVLSRCIRDGLVPLGPSIREELVPLDRVVQRVQTLAPALLDELEPRRPDPVILSTGGLHVRFGRNARWELERRRDDYAASTAGLATLVARVDGNDSLPHDFCGAVAEDLRAHLVLRREEVSVRDFERSCRERVLDAVLTHFVEELDEFVQPIAFYCNRSSKQAYPKVVRLTHEFLVGELEREAFCRRLPEALDLARELRVSSFAYGIRARRGTDTHWFASVIPALSEIDDGPVVRAFKTTVENQRRVRLEILRSIKGTDARRGKELMADFPEFPAPLPIGTRIDVEFCRYGEAGLQVRTLLHETGAELSCVRKEGVFLEIAPADRDPDDAEVAGAQVLLQALVDLCESLVRDAESGVPEHLEREIREWMLDAIGELEKRQSDRHERLFSDLVRLLRERAEQSVAFLARRVAQKVGASPKETSVLLETWQRVVHARVEMERVADEILERLVALESAGSIDADTEAVLRIARMGRDEPASFHHVVRVLQQTLEDGDVSVELEEHLASLLGELNQAAEAPDVGLGGISSASIRAQLLTVLLRGHDDEDLRAGIERLSERTTAWMHLRSEWLLQITRLADSPLAADRGLAAEIAAWLGLVEGVLPRVVTFVNGSFKVVAAAVGGMAKEPASPSALPDELLRVLADEAAPGVGKGESAWYENLVQTVERMRNVKRRDSTERAQGYALIRQVIQKTLIEEEAPAGYDSNEAIIDLRAGTPSDASPANAEDLLEPCDEDPIETDREEEEAA